MAVCLFEISLFNFPLLWLELMFYVPVNIFSVMGGHFPGFPYSLTFLNFVTK